MKTETIYFGAGCFWCVEAVFQRLKGVLYVESGYMGGEVDHPTYEMICTGRTGHAEVVKVIYDPEVISFEVLLKVLWGTHDPTTLNQQGADRGTQYRSAIFYTTDEQRDIAIASKVDVAPTLWDKPIVTEITPASTYYPAEAYHQNYFNNHSTQSYCAYVIQPKIAKLIRSYRQLLHE
jgi:peptide-methionine (S)-S-oxide reductase